MIYTELELVAEVERLRYRVAELERAMLVTSYAPPVKPNDPMLRIADGVQWNPGSGKGIYLWQSGSWVKL